MFDLIEHLVMTCCHWHWIARGLRFGVVPTPNCQTNAFPKREANYHQIAELVECKELRPFHQSSNVDIGSQTRMNVYFIDILSSYPQSFKMQHQYKYSIIGNW